MQLGFLGVPDGLFRARRGVLNNERYRRSLPSWVSRREAKKKRYRCRDEMFVALGDSCACCGEFRKEMLTLDHINGDGAEERRRTGVHKSAYLAKRNGWDKARYRILCFNCNCSRGQAGECAHELERRASLVLVA